MRQRKIISLAVLVLTLALSGGCQRMPEPDAGSGTIRFNTSSLQLSTGMTKGGTTKEGPTFSTDGSDSFAVFGWHAEGEGEGENWIFDNQKVTCGAVDATRNTTSYDPIQSWEWANNTTDYYDFIAFYKWKSGNYTKSFNPVSVTVPYDATTEQYDLMAAGMRRLGTDEATREEIVPLTFRHILCAVKVVVYNDSENKFFTLTNLHFKGLVVSADAELTLTPPSNVSVNWTDPAVNTNSELFGYSSSSKTVNYGKNVSWPEDEIIDEIIIKHYNLLVPQTLTAASLLEMDFWYSKGGGNIKNSSLSLGLSTIPNETDGRLLTTWEAGYKYEYRIHIRVDGGVVVSVITTQWDPVEAQTHGIML